MGNYFTYKKNGNHVKYLTISKQRPGNQSSPAVLKKITTRIKKLISDNDDVKLTELYEKFLELVEDTQDDVVDLLGNKIDIAHHIAIGAFMDYMVKVMDGTEPYGDPKDFFDDLLSTEEENDDKGRGTMGEIFEVLRNKNASPDDKIAKANKMADFLNRSSRNLMPGHASTNRSIKKSRDDHLILKHGKLQETPTSKKLSKSINTLFHYVPKTRIDQDGNIEIQSSAISNAPYESYYVADDDEADTDEEQEANVEELMDEGRECLNTALEYEAKYGIGSILDCKKFERLTEIIEELREHGASGQEYANELAELSADIELRQDESERIKYRF